MRLAMNAALGVVLAAGLAGCEVVKWVHEPHYAEPSAATYTAGSYEIGGDGSPERVAGAAVSPEFFREAQAPPLLGRQFVAEERSPATVVMIGQAIWARRFGSNPSLIGKPLVVDGRPLTIVGVMPKGFSFPPGAEVWIPR
jgi:hypothetical protein